MKIFRGHQVTGKFILPHVNTAWPLRGGRSPAPLTQNPGGRGCLGLADTWPKTVSESCLTLAPEAETKFGFPRGPKDVGEGWKRSKVPTVGTVEQVQSRTAGYQDRQGWVLLILELGSLGQRLRLSPAAILLLSLFYLPVFPNTRRAFSFSFGPAASRRIVRAEKRSIPLGPLSLGSLICSGRLVGNHQGRTGGSARQSTDSESWSPCELRGFQGRGCLHAPCNLSVQVEYSNRCTAPNMNRGW